MARSVRGIRDRRHRTQREPSRDFALHSSTAPASENFDDVAQQRGRSSPASRRLAPPPGRSRCHTLDLRELLRALQRVRDGDFSVRLPGDWTGLDGKIADTFNEIVAANAEMAARARARRRRSSASRARPASASSSAARSGAWGEMEASVNTLIDDLLWPDHRGDARDRRRRPGRPAADHAPRRRRPPARGRVPALGDHRQHDDRAARRVHLRGDARGARGRHRRQARRPGAGAAASAASGRTSPRASTRWPAT